MKYLLTLALLMASIITYGQNNVCDVYADAMENLDSDGYKVELLDDCSEMTIIVWDTYASLNLESNVKSIVRSELRKVAAIFMTEDSIMITEAVGLERIYIKVLGDAEPVGYITLQTMEITLL